MEAATSMSLILPVTAALSPAGSGHLPALPGLTWLHLLSDLGIGLACLSIPAALLVFLRRRRDLAYPWAVGLLALFILACGGAHLTNAWASLQPAGIVAGTVKALAAMVAVVAAIALWPLLPRLLALPSASALQREVEERRAAEARALASEARTAAFVANLAEAIFVIRVEPDGRFVVETVNPAFERLFAIPRSAVEERPAEEALPMGIIARALPHWRECVASGRTCEYAMEADTPAGHVAWQTVLVPMRNAAGRVERLLGSARDVTATHRLQAGLVQTARLATVGTMCAGLAHETSQPLNAALLWLRSARAVASGVPAEAGARLSRALSIVEGQIRRTGELVGRIRALAGAESGTPEGFDAAEVVAAAARTAAGQYAPEGIELAFERDPAPMPVQGKPARLEQAVLQLLSNARDAVLDRRQREPGAPARISVSLRRVGGRVAVEVRDSGDGIPEALRDTIFDPFFTTKDPGRGIGLGLPLAAGIARAMGGGIEVWNLADGGACFRMELALAESPAAVAA